MQPTDFCLSRERGTRFDSPDITEGKTLVCHFCDFRMSFQLDNKISAKFKDEIIADNVIIHFTCYYVSHIIIIINFSNSRIIITFAYNLDETN